MSSAGTDLDEACDPRTDARGFRDALGQFGTGVTVVTTRDGDALVGMTANSFSALSLDPPLILWSIRQASKRARVILRAQAFVVNVLADTQSGVARAFASDPAPTGLFDDVSWSEGLGGCPVLAGTVARFECRQHEVRRAGDHHLIVGAVERCSVTAGSPLLFVQGEFVGRHALTPDDEIGADESATEAPGHSEDAASFARVVTAASYGLSRRFDEYRARLGLTVGEGRILERLSRRPMTVDELGESAYLGPRAVEDAVERLTRTACVVRSGDRFELTEAGDLCRRRLAEAAEEFHGTVLDEIPQSDLRVARRVLETFANPSV